MERSNAIQGWRGLAIIMVFLAHTRTFISPDMTLFSDFGEKGVYIFIVLSGILLYKNSLTKAYAGNLKDGFRYALGKVKHLYPLHLVLWLIMFLATTTKDNLMRQIVYSVFNVSLTQSFIPFSGIINSFNGPSWYLSMCLFLWVMTPVFITFVERYHLRDRKGKPFFVSALIWILWLNIGNLVLRLITSMSSAINPSWFERWLLYSCPLLDFVIFVMAYFGCGYFEQKRINQGEQLLIATVVIVLSIALKGNIPILWNIPFVASIILLVTHTLNNKEAILTNIMSCKLLVFMGNISSYFFLIHGVINLLISGTDLENMRPWIFFISFAVSLVLSYLIYCFTRSRKKALSF